MFVDRARVVLTLVVGGSTFTFPSGSFEEFSLDARVYAFEATAAVYLSSELDTDELFPLFTTEAAIQATLSINSCVMEGTGEEVPPIKFTGLVVEKKLVEEVGEDVDGMPVVGRTYQVRFQDAASVLWRQHHPLELHTEVSMQQVIELHKLQGIDLAYDWTRLGVKQDILTVPTGAESGVSFYDLVIWFLDQHGGLLELDAAEGAYRISDTKKRASSPVELEREYTEQLRVRLPEPERYKPRLLNGTAESAQTTVVTNDLAHTGVLRDALLRTPIASHIEGRQRVVESKLRVGMPELHVDFARLPPQLAQPGMFLKLGEDFSERLLVAKKTFRVIELRLEAQAANNPEDEVPELEDETAPFNITTDALLEQASDPRPRLPAYQPPRFPVRVEGKIVSSGGGPEDRTWMMASGETDAIFRYTVQIPLWNKKIPAPFEPNHLPGHLFFPAYKDQRVLVALGFDSATIRRHLDWAANARTPLDGQGNRLALGYQANNGTVVDHTYQDGKPIFSILRTFGNDLQSVIVKEGTLFIEVKEDESADELEPRFDVTVVVTSSKERVAGEVRGAINEVTGSFESSMGSTSARIDGAVEELSGAVDSTEAQMASKIEAANAQLEELSSSLAAMVAELSAAVAAAKAELQKALS